MVCAGRPNSSPAARTRRLSVTTSCGVRSSTFAMLKPFGCENSLKDLGQDTTRIISCRGARTEPLPRYVDSSEKCGFSPDRRLRPRQVGRGGQLFIRKVQYLFPF